MIIFDEIDAICKQRGSVQSGSGVHDTVVNQLLTKIDGVDALNNILLIGMTNRCSSTVHCKHLCGHSVNMTTFLLVMCYQSACGSGVLIALGVCTSAKTHQCLPDSAPLVDWLLKIKEGLQCGFL